MREKTKIQLAFDPFIDDDDGRGVVFARL